MPKRTQHQRRLEQHDVNSNDFIGLWALDPDSSDYGPLPAPQSAVYTILPSAGDHGLSLHAQWTDAEGQYAELGFLIAADGVGRPSPDGSGHTMAAFVEGDALVTEVRDGDLVVHRAARRLDGDTLWIEQELDGHTLRAAYQRARAKQVILYRRDLKMRKGKIAAQVAHASLKVFFDRDVGGPGELRVPIRGDMAWWCQRNFAKVVLSVADEETLLAAHQHAKDAGLPTALITDSGRTEFHGVPTHTTVAIGPAHTERIDVITGRTGLVETKLA